MEGVPPPPPVHWGGSEAGVRGNLSRGVVLPSLRGNFPAGEPVAPTPKVLQLPHVSRHLGGEHRQGHAQGHTGLMAEVTT